MSDLKRDPRPPRVSIVVPCFNHAQFLGEAIDSILVQSFEDFEIIVVDDGSTDDTSKVAQSYDKVRYIRQENQGLAAARNAGLRASYGSYLVFLDADDRLLPQALQAGLDCFATFPAAAFVSGGHRRIDIHGGVLTEPTPPQIETDPYRALLQGNYVGMHAAVMYRRDPLQSHRGFNEKLPVCEDYELYLRLARSCPVQCHQAVIADYRTYGTSMSGDTALMLRTVTRVLRAQRAYFGGDLRCHEAYRAGLDYWRSLYVDPLVSQIETLIKRRDIRRAFWGLVTLVNHDRIEARRLAIPFMRKTASTVMPRWLLRLLDHRQGETYNPRVGRVDFGDLRRTKPISMSFGFDRGLPVDRYYIEKFLTEHASDIRGRVLEIGDNTYTWQFGKERVTKSDVMHVTEGNPLATFVGNLPRADSLPSAAFDCVILTQTLHLIYDVRAALQTLNRILKPSGVLLLTVPGISQLSNDQWRETWYWSFTTLSLERLLADAFPQAGIEIESHGNVLSATAFLQGLASQELSLEELDYQDPHYQLVVLARIVRCRQTNDETG